MVSEPDWPAAIHDCTNALTVITGWLERARRAIDDPATTLRAIQRAERYASNARDAMRQTLGAPVQAPPPEPLATLLADISDDLSWEASQRSVALELKEDQVTGRAPEPAALWSVLTNLVLNAIAMSEEGGSVRISAALLGEHRACIDVIDDGPGVPAALRDQLFEGGESHRPGGAGIGLRHAAALTRSAGGTIELIPTEVGATFRVKWPLTPAGSSSSHPVRPKDIGGARILLLEDDSAVVELLELALGARGAELTVARDAAQLDVHLDQRDSYDVLLVDLSPLTAQRGGMITEDEGLERALTKARTNNPEIGVVVMSGSVKVAPRDDVAWVRKPFAPAELVDAIAKHRPRRT